MASPSNPRQLEDEYTGKVTGIIDHRFGDFEAFILLTDGGKETRFKGREERIESLVRFAWEKRAVITLFEESTARPICPSSLVLRRLD